MVITTRGREGGGDKRKCATEFGVVDVKRQEGSEAHKCRSKVNITYLDLPWGFHFAAMTAGRALYDRALHRQCQRACKHGSRRGVKLKLIRAVAITIRSQARMESHHNHHSCIHFFFLQEQSGTTTNSRYETIGHQNSSTLRHRTRFRPHVATTFPFSFQSHCSPTTSGRRLARTAEATKSNVVVVVRLSNGWKDSAGLLRQRVRHRGNL